MAADDGTSLPAPVTVSAPGKVLITGGYLVLEPPLPGLVLSTTARFHSTVELLQAPIGGLVSPEHLRVDVVSPQFHSTRRYDLHLGGSPASTLTPAPGEPADGANPYVERTIAVAVMTATALLPAGRLVSWLGGFAGRGVYLRITLRADNDFYSQVDHLRERSMPVSSEALASLPPFMPCPLSSAGDVIVSKTGMGSSAALITSLTGALMAMFRSVCLPTSVGGLALEDEVAEARGEVDADASLRLVHHLAQVAHGLAQGKIGSGFDVCAASYGGMRYTRVSPEMLGKFMGVVDSGGGGDGAGGGGDAASDTATASAGEVLADSRREDWDYTIAPFALPEGLTLMMADVRGGSGTPSMVRKVLAWRKASGEDGAKVWDSLAAANAEVEGAMRELEALASGGNSSSSSSSGSGSGGDSAAVTAAAFADGIAACSAAVSSEWASLDGPVPAVLARLAASFRKVRGLLKRMGDGAGVPIEPDEQTALADETCKLPGVAMAGVPGAGGNDALFAILVGNDSRAAVEKLWLEWPSGSLCPLLLREGSSVAVGPGAGVRVEAE